MGRTNRFIARAAAGLIAAAALVLGASGPASARPLAYVANSGTDDVTPFTIQRGGRLAAAPPASVGASPQGTAATPDGRYLYVALDGDAVAAFSIAPRGGLTELPGSPFPAGLNPRVPAVSPDGSHLYVANFGADTIGIYAIGSNGGLTPAGAVGTGGDGPTQIAFAPDGDHLYAPNFGTDTVAAFSVGPGGGLTPVAGSPFPAGDFPANVAVSPDGSKLYVSNRGTLVNPVDTISGYTIAASGALTPAPGSPFTSLANPDGLAFTNDGSQLYSAGGGSNFVARYAVAPSGALTSLPGGAATGDGPAALFKSPDGDALFAVNGTAASVSGYAIRPASLSPAPGSPFPTGGTAPTGRAVAVVQTDSRAEIRASARTRQKIRGKRVAVKVKVSSGETVDVRLAGAVFGRGLKRSKLKTRTVGLVPREPLVVKLKPKKRRAAKAIAAHVADAGRASARIRVTATDELGNVATRSLLVKLKPKRR